MEKDKELEELFLAQKPHFDDGADFMAALTKRLDAVEFIKQHQEATVRRYKMAMAVAFVVGIISGGVAIAFMLSAPADVPLFTFEEQNVVLQWVSEHSRVIFATALALLISLGIVSLINNVQEMLAMQRQKGNKTLRYFPYMLLLLSMLLVGCTTKPESIGDLESAYVTMDDSVRIHYKQWGEGDKAICFVHGFGCDMNTWEKQFEGLRDENLHLVFIDLPGYGESSKPHVEYTLDFFARAVNKVLDETKVDTVVLVGHSLGTPVCRQVLLTGSRPSNLFDIDGVYCFYDGTETQEYVDAIQQFGHAFDGPDCRQVIEGFVASLAGPETPQEITDYAMSVMPQTPQYVASSTMRNLVERRWWPQTQIGASAGSGQEGKTIVVCTQNSGLDPDNRQKMERLYPQLDYTELTTCGHFIHMEQAEMINEKLRKLAVGV
ncbi:MAG: alpha/beta hydrolase [Bacteroidaceae bacterium]|nr:alpha/beta hydrolase [Bacteroidaceae bacterium]